MEKLTSSDAWILQSIAIASFDKEASLEDVIATGDYINHAIFTAGELQKGILKLYKLKYIGWENGFYALTVFGKKVLFPILKKKFSLLKELDQISKKIGATAWSSKEKLPEYDSNLDPAFFTLQEFNEVCKKYLESVKNYSNDGVVLQ